MLGRHIIGRVQDVASRRPWSVKLAVLLRNQCQCIIRNAFNDSNEMAGNGEVRVIEALAPTLRQVVDVGANVGDWTAQVTERAPDCRAILFDAGGVAVSTLRNRFNGNPRIDVVHKGVSDRAGELVFFEESAAGKTSSFAPGFSVSGAERRLVEVTTLDQELAGRSITRVDLLKIDVEGYDMHVLRGARRLLEEQRIGVVQFEYNAPWATSGATLGEAINLLTVCGYEVFALKSAGLFTFDYRLTGEFFGYSNFVAVSREQLPTIRALLAGTVP